MTANARPITPLQLRRGSHKHHRSRDFINPGPRRSLTRDWSWLVVAQIGSTARGWNLLAQVVVSDTVVLQDVVQFEFPAGKALRPGGNLGYEKARIDQSGLAWTKEEMDRASHHFGKCSECLEIICVEKAVTDTRDTQPETSDMLYKAFRAHVKLKHSEDFSQAA